MKSSSYGTAQTRGNELNKPRVAVTGKLIIAKSDSLYSQWGRTEHNVFVVPTLFMHLYCKSFSCQARDNAEKVTERRISSLFKMHNWLWQGVILLSRSSFASRCGEMNSFHGPLRGPGDPQISENCPAFGWSGHRVAQRRGSLEECSNQAPVMPGHSAH